MATSACLPIAADRAGPCVRTIRIVGLDLSGIAQRIEVRMQPDNPIMLFALGMAASAAAEGLFLLDVETDADGLKTSVMQVRIAKATMQDAGLVPYMGEIGDASTLAYGWVATIAGDDRQLAYGPFNVVPTVIGASAAPAYRLASAGSGYQNFGVWNGAQLTFSDDSVAIAIDGAPLLAPMVLEATTARDTSVASAIAAQLAQQVAGTFVNGVLHDTVAEGLASAVEGGYFSVRGAGGAYADIYRVVNGAAMLQSSFASQASYASGGGAGQIGYGGRTVAEKLAERPSSIDIGAKADGATDDQPALTAAAVPIVFPRQDHYIGQDLTVDVSVDMFPGSRLILPPGVTFMPRAGFRGDHGVPIFAGTNAGRGAVNLRQAALLEAVPEWWGNDPNDGWSPAIEAAQIAHPRVRLQLRDYLINRTTHLQPYSRIVGQLDRYQGDSTASAILATYANNAIVQAGATTLPPGAVPNDAPFGMGIARLHIGRTVQPIADDNCRGLVIGFTDEFRCDEITSDSSRYSISVDLAVHAEIRSSQVKCSTAGSLDTWVGIFAGGAELTAINDNPSLYVIDCTGSCSPTLPNSTHIRIYGRGTDFYEKGNFETTGAAIGLEYDATSMTEGSSNDMICDQLTIDQYTDHGVIMNNLPNFGHFQIDKLYCGVAAGGTGRAILSTGTGSLTVLSGQAYMAASNSDQPIYVINNIGTKISMLVSEAKRGVVATAAVSCEFNIQVFSQTVAMSAAIQFTDHCTDNVCTVRPKGGTANKIGVAYQSDDVTNDYNEFLMTPSGRAFIATKTDFAPNAELHSVKTGVQ